MQAAEPEGFRNRGPVLSNTLLLPFVDCLARGRRLKASHLVTAEDQSARYQGGRGPSRHFICFNGRRVAAVSDSVPSWLCCRRGPWRYHRHYPCRLAKADLYS